MRVSLANLSSSFSVDADQSVLDAGLAAGLDLIHSCKTGNCGACRAQLIEGRVRHRHGLPLGLSPSAQAEGEVLLCQALPLTDLVIDVPRVMMAGAARIKRLPGRIETVSRLSHDVLGLWLRLPPAEPFEFLPGQYIDILISGGRRRSYSIASPPHDAKLLELHVRRVPGGELSGALFDGDPGNRVLSIEGPLGQFHYRAPVSTGSANPPPPMLLVGGGTGLAPLLSIMRHVIANRIERRMLLYWGVSAEIDLYAHARLCDLARRAADLTYIPVLSAPEATWSGRRGWVHETVLEDFPALRGYEIYASGPPAMIEALRRDFVAHGADASQMFHDSFDYAPDALARQRMSDSTKT